jgi:Tol biopolymer transport system component
LRWSPDGKAALVCGWEKRRIIGAYLVDSQTGATKILVDNLSGKIPLGEWTADGRGFYYVSGGAVVLHDLESGREKQLFENPDLIGSLALSPNGLSLAAGLDNSESGAELTILDVSSGEVRQLLTFPESGAIRAFEWAPDGRHLFYIKKEEETNTDGCKWSKRWCRAMSLWRVDERGGTPEKLWQTEESDWLGGLRIHPDGNQLAFNQVRHETATWVMEGFIPGMASPD